MFMSEKASIHREYIFMRNHSPCIGYLLLFFYPKIWADVKTKTKTIAKAHTYGDVERSSPAQVGLVIRTSTASITRSILPRRLRLWVCCQCDVSLSSVWRQRWAAGTGSQWLSVRALKELRNHTPPHCHPHVTLVPLYRTNACEKHSARWRNHQAPLSPQHWGTVGFIIDIVSCHWIDILPKTR